MTGVLLSDAARTALDAYLAALDVPAVLIVVPQGGEPLLFRLEPPPAPPEARLSDTEEDLLNLVADSPGPLTTLQILSEASRLDWPHSEDQLKKALARLTSAGKLVNEQRARPRGYRLPPRPH